MNIIGDVAGQYKTLMALLKKMPDDLPFSIGDMVDRGPQSKEVLDFFMKNGRAMLGNHEHMMACEYEAMPSPYRNGVWHYNGGGATLRSFGATDLSYNEARDLLAPYLHWIATLPLSLAKDGVFLSHAPVSPFKDSPEQCVRIADRFDFEDSLIWNRFTPPKPMEGLFQVFGHNNWQGGETFEVEGKKAHAMCIDKSGQNILMGLHWPSMKVYEQEYLD
jgi:hypothetical protein